MKKLNLTPEIVALLTKEANHYIMSFQHSEVHDAIHREKLVKDFIACFEPADSNSEVYETRDVCSRFLGWRLNRSRFLNEYWVEKEHLIVKVWAKNRAAVRKYFKEDGYYPIPKSVVAKEFGRVAVINALTSEYHRVVT